MEKLIRLLDEYHHKKTKDLERGKERVEEHKHWIISKQFGFIKRLVDNDKIEKNYKEGLPAITKNGFLLEGETVLLMLLAISDTPIDDLISYLK